MTLTDSIQAARECLGAARRVTVLCGAGLSEESGLPTFRGAAGLWRNFRAEELATPQAFERDPKLVWEWYEWRREQISQAHPNLGHYALAALERRLGDGFALITQNVDGLHNRAGSQRILKIHGDIWWTQCTACRKVTTELRVPLDALPPHCESCGAVLRPAIVWFGEPLPAETWRQAQQAAMNCEVMIVVGTSAVVQPAAGLAPLAQRAGARLIEINRAETPLSGTADITLRGAAGELLPQLIDE